MPKQVIRTVLSGSFRKDKTGLEQIYDELITCGCQVLSPHRMNFDEDIVFVRDSAEKGLSATEIERHHLTSIKQSDFLWLHAPNGYVGFSAAVEMGYAIAHGVPIFTNYDVNEPGLRSFIHVVPSVYKAISKLSEEITL